MAHAPQLAGDRVSFVALPTGDLIVEDEQGDADLSPLADAVERNLSPPYRAVAERQQRRPMGDRRAIGSSSSSSAATPATTSRSSAVTAPSGRRSTGRTRAFPSPSWSRTATLPCMPTRIDGDFWEVEALAALTPRYPSPGWHSSSALREGPTRRRGPAAQAARRAGGLHRDARAGLREALGRRARREDGRAPRARRERREPRRDPLRGVRRRARGVQAHDGRAPVRRPADGRHRPPRGRHRRDEDRRGQDLRRRARALPQRAQRQGHAPRHRQRLPRQARPGVDAPRVHRARDDDGRRSRT